jgi:predicted phage gp36 major capsid-like protein
MGPEWIALIGTLCGGIGLKIAEKALGRSQEKSDDAHRIRDELRLRITEQNEEIKELEGKLAVVTKDYYDLRDQYTQVKTELFLALEQLKNK